MSPDNHYVIRCPIHGTIELNKREMALIDHPVVQRLRHISQLAFGSLVYPSAVHSRFSHSLGTMHLAGILFDRLCVHGSPPLTRTFSRSYLKQLRQIIRFAALLHDVGHPPFSHVLEDNIPPIGDLKFAPPCENASARRSAHEDLSLLLIQFLTQDSEKALTAEEARSVSELIYGSQHADSFFQKDGFNLFPLVLHLINAEIDADRMDYLLRDSYFTGVKYGQFDSNHIIRSLSTRLDHTTGDIVLALQAGGITAYENFLLARAHMFIQVYFHKSLPGFRHYLKNALKEEIRISITTEPSDYVRLQEHTIYQELHRQANTFWSGKIVRREPMKLLDRIIQPTEDHMAEHRRLCRELRSSGIRAIAPYSYNLYSYQKEPLEKKSGSILVARKKMGKTTYENIGNVSALLKTAPQKIEISQVCVLREDYDKALAHCNG